jgi:hypothetical protein
MANTYGIKSVSGSLQELEMSRYGGTEYSVLTASSGQAGITLQNIASGTVTHFTSSYAKITNLDVDVINTIATTQTTLEIADKLIIAASGANSANSDGGGLQIGGVTSGNPVASVKYDHTNTALDFNIGSTTQVRLQDGAFLPETDSDVDLGASGKLFKNLYVDAFGANWTNAGRTVADLGAVTTVDINGGSVDGTTIGGSTAANGTFLTLSSSAADINGGAIDGVAIGLTSSAGGAFTTLDCNDGAFAVANLDIDGATDINAALVDADLFIVDDGAGGTNRKSAMSRIPTYLNNHTSLTSLTSLVAVGTITTGVWNGSVIQDAYVANNLTLSGSTMNNSVIGGVQPAAATFTTMIAKGNVDLGDATSDTITATGRFDSDLVPSTDSARSLGTSALQWANIHADAGAIDAVTVTSVTDGSATLTGGVLSGLTRLGAADAPVSNVFATNVVTGDFHMRNERGDWTLFEESDHIRIRNNATGQTFKMDMTLIEE